MTKAVLAGLLLLSLLSPTVSLAAPAITEPADGAQLDSSKLLLIQASDLPGRQLMVESTRGAESPSCFNMTEDPASLGTYRLAADVRPGGMFAALYRNVSVQLRVVRLAAGARFGCQEPGGEWSPRVNVTFGEPAPAPPIVRGVTINTGEVYTKTRQVKLTIEPCPCDGVLQSAATLLVANDGGFAGGKEFSREPISLAFDTGKTAVDIPWTLQSSGPERLPKTVYVRGIGSDDIILDEKAPAIRSASMVGGGASASASRLRVRVLASDTNSGVASALFASNKSQPGTTIPYKRTMTIAGISKPKWVRVQDKAGNFSRWKALK